MSTATKFEMDEKLSMNTLIMSFMDYTNNRIKLMEEEIKQNKNKINILEKELNDTKTNNQEYKHKIHVSENDHIYDINKKLDEIVSYKISEMNEKMFEIDQKFDYMDEKIAERLDEHTEDTDDKITEKLNEIYDKCNQKIDELDSSINTNEELIHKITGLETQFQEFKDKITGLETELDEIKNQNKNYMLTNVIQDNLESLVQQITHYFDMFDPVITTLMKTSHLDCFIVILGNWYCKDIKGYKYDIYRVSKKYHIIIINILKKYFINYFNKYTNTYTHDNKQYTHECAPFTPLRFTLCDLGYTTFDAEVENDLNIKIHETNTDYEIRILQIILALFKEMLKGYKHNMLSFQGSWTEIKVPLNLKI